MHICGHVFMVLKYNLLAKHPMFTKLMEECYYLRTQNGIKSDEPFNAPPIPLGRDFFLFNLIEC
jgi:hypothetical protein